MFFRDHTSDVPLPNEPQADREVKKKIKSLFTDGPVTDYGACYIETNTQRNEKEAAPSFVYNDDYAVQNSGYSEVDHVKL